MTEHEKSRLERLETFVERLKLGSYFAKAADEGKKLVGQPLSSTDRDLTRAAIGRGEGTIAKAVSGFNDAGSLLAYADTVIDDPTVMGIVSGHLSAGDMLEAKRTVLEAAERGTVAKAAEVMAEVAGAGSDADLAAYDSRAATSEMIARFGKIEQLLSSLEARLSALERRSQAAQVDDNTQLVAKAAAPKGKRTPEEEADHLMGQIDAYVDSPNVVGTLSSMVAAGEFKQVRAAVARAKQAHESARLVNERKSWGN